MKKIAIYGKGGSGKSTVSAALSVTFSRRGDKVLHVGCDPKADSTLTLTDGFPVPTLLDLLYKDNPRPRKEEFVFPTRRGIDCVEAGGPEPGSGCGGRGIARMFELFGQMRLLENGGYDLALFDVLGDVVCGGFAAPLRMGFADRAFIVVSEEPLSLFAANNIIHAIRTYSANGVRLGGLIVNVSDSGAAVERVLRYAKAISVPIAGIIPRDPAIQDAEFDYETAAELPVGSPTVAAFEKLADFVEGSFATELSIPEPLSREALFELASDGRSKPRRIQRAPVAEGLGVAAADNAVSTGEEQVGDSPVSREIPRDRVVLGGDRSRESFERLFGFHRPQARRQDLAVSAVRLRGEALEIGVVAGDRAAFVVRLKPLSKESQQFASTDELSIAHATPLDRAARQVMEFLVRHIQKASPPFQQLVSVVTKDPDAQVESADKHQRSVDRSADGTVPRHWNVWGGKSTQGRFFFSEERSRLVMGELRLSDDIPRIHHATDACQFSEQDTSPYSWHFVKHPWPVRKSADPVVASRNSLLTNIRDYEMINGSNARFEEALNRLPTASVATPLWVDVSCIPAIAGEDFPSAITHFEERTGRLVATTGVSDASVVFEFSRIGRRFAASLPKRETLPGTVALLGFPETAAVDELVDLLVQSGLKVVGRQVPELDFSQFEALSQAHTFLVWPQWEYRLLVNDIFGVFPGNRMEVVPPYGVDGTVRFIEGVLAQCGLSDVELPEEVKAKAARVSEELQELTVGTKQIRLGLATTEDQVGLLEKPERFCGVPLKDFLESMGFAVEVLSGSEDTPRLNWWLGSGVSAVYSDLTVDRRLARRGVAAFSLAHLEPGLDGALRTARRLLQLCEAGFVGQYRWVIEQTREGE